jgi:hypothetical protein
LVISGIFFGHVGFEDKKKEEKKLEQEYKKLKTKH